MFQWTSGGRACSAVSGMKPKMWWYKRSSWPHLLARWLMLFATTGYVLLPTSVVWANPTGEQVVGGSATFDRQGNTLTVNQATDRLAVNWQDFSIAAGERTHFNMPSSASIALNRVLGGNPSQIYGTLSSNGNIILVNNAGIFVGPGGVVNAASFVGSTLDIDPGQFMQGGVGGYQLHGDSYAPIVSQGNITAEKGDVFLIAQKVENRGTISAPNGKAAMIGAGKAEERTEVVLHEVGGSGFAVRVAQLQGEDAGGSNHGLPDGEELLNEGEITAAQAELNASGNIYALAIKNSGTIRAKAVVAQADGTVRLDGGLGDVRNTGTLIAKNAGDEATAAGGKIEVTGQNVTASPESIITAAGGVQGGDGGKVKIDSADTTIVQGKVDVTAPSAGAKGGKVELLGEKVGLFEGAKVNASGGAGGGTVLAGGDYLGGQTPKPELVALAKQEAEPVKNAKATVMAETAEIKADATVNGDGGKIILWSDEYTGFYGDLFARGGAEGGNGGFIETSSKNNLQAFGLVNTGSTLGRGGNWLLDPTDVTIDNSPSNSGGDFDGTPATTWTYAATPAAGQATVSITSLQAALLLGSVTISTSSTGGGAGNITVDGTITNIGNGNTLTLIADNEITINSPITLAGSISLNANGGSITTNANISSTTGTVSMIAGGGAITLNGTTTAAGILGRSSGDIQINNAVTSTGGETIKLISAGDVTGPGLISLDPVGGLSIDTTGDVSVSVTSGPTAVRTTGDVTLFSGAGGTITVGQVNGINGLSGADISVTAGTIELGGAPVDATGNFTALAATGIDFIAPSNRFSPAVTTGGNQSFQGDITLSADTALASGGNMQFNNTIDGAFDLLLLVQGFTDLFDQVGATTPLTSFRQEGGLINFYAASSPAITTSGSTTFDGANLVLWNNTSFTSGVDLIVLGTINSSTADVPVTLSATAAGNVILDGAVGGTAALGALNVTATAGQIAINSGMTTLPGDTPFNPGADGSILLTAGGAVVLAGPIDTRGGLTAPTVIGGSLTINSGGGVNQNIQIQSTINTRGGAITFQDPVFFTGASTLNTTIGNISGVMNFNGTTDGDPNVAVTLQGGTGQITFGGALGSTNPFNLTVGSAGGLVFNNSVLLGAGASSLTSLAGSVVFASSIDKLGGVLTLASGTQAITFGGTVGGTNPFGLTVSTSGAVTLNQAVRMGGAFTFNNLSGAFQANDSIEGAFALTINPVNSLASVSLQEVGTKINAGVETLVPVASLTIGNGNSAILLNGSILTSGGAINFGSPVTANDSLSLSTTARGATGGGISFLNTFQGATGAEDLTIRAGQGALTFGDSISSLNLFNVASAGSMDFTSSGAVTAGSISVQAAINSQRNVTLTSTAGDITIDGGLSARPSNSSGIGGTATLVSAGDINISGLMDVSGRSGTFVVFSPDGSSSTTVATVGFKGGTASLTAGGTVSIGSLNANGGNNFATGGNGGNGGTVSIVAGSGVVAATILANGGSDGNLGGNGGVIAITRSGGSGALNIGSMAATGGTGFNNGGAGGIITLAASLGDLQAPSSYLTQGGEATGGPASTRNLFAGLGGTVNLRATVGSVFFQNQTLTLQGDSTLAVQAGSNIVMATDLSTRSGGVVITGNEGALRSDRRGSLNFQYGSGEFFMPSSSYLVSQGGLVKIYSTSVGAGAVSISGISTVGSDVNGGSIEIHQEAGSAAGVVTIASALETFGGIPVSPAYGRNGGAVKISGTAVAVNRINTSGSASLATATSPAFGGAGGDVNITGTTITLTSGSTVTASDFSINTTGGTGLGTADANGGGGGSITFVGDLVLNSGNATRTKTILNTQGGVFAGGGNSGLSGNITTTGKITGTQTTSNTLDLRYGDGTVTLGDGLATPADDLITLGTLITAADDARSTGTLILNGALDLGTLTTYAREYGIQINGGGTVDNTVTFNNTGNTGLGSLVATTIFTGGLTASAPASVQLRGLIESGDAANPGTGAPMSFGVVELVGNTTLNSNGSNLSLGRIDGAFDLTLAAGIGVGVVDISSTIGANTRVGAITVSEGIVQPVTFRDSIRATTLDGQAGTALSFFGNVDLTGSATLQGLTTLDNTLFESQNSTLDFLVGAASSLNEVVLVSGPIRLTGAGNYSIQGAVTGNQNLKLAGAGTKVFASTIGSATAPVGSGVAGIDQADGSGTVTFQGDVFTSGVSTFDGSVVLSGMTYTSADRVDFGGDLFDAVTLEGGTVTLAGAGEKFFNGTLDSTVGLVQGATAGKVTFENDVTSTGVAGTFSLAGDVEFAGLVFSSGGEVTLSQAVTLSEGQVTLTGDGTYTVVATMNGAQNLVLAGGGTKSFTGAIGATTAIGTGAGAAIQISGGDVTLGAVTTASGISSASALTLTGNTQVLATGDTDSNFANTVQMAGITFTSGLGVVYGADVTLASGSAGATTTTLGGTGAYLFLGDLNATAAGVQSLAFTSTGDVIFGGIVGTVRLGGLSQTSTAGGMEFQANVFTAGSSTFAGNVILSGMTFDANGATLFDTVELGGITVTLSGEGTQTFTGLLTGNGVDLNLNDGGNKTLAEVNNVGGFTINSAGITSLLGNVTATSVTQNGGSLRLGGDVTTTGGVNLDLATSITTLGSIVVTSAGDQNFETTLILGGNLEANAGAGNQVRYGAVSGSGNMTTTANSISVTPTTVRNAGTFTGIQAGGGPMTVGALGVFMDDISLGAVRSTGGLILETAGGITADTFVAGTGVTLKSTANAVTAANVFAPSLTVDAAAAASLTSVTTPGALTVETGAVDDAFFFDVRAGSMSLDAGSVNGNAALSNLDILVPALGNITLRSAAQNFSYSRPGNLSVSGRIDVNTGTIDLQPTGNFVNLYQGNPFTAAGGTRILTRDFFSYPNSAGVVGLTPVFGVSSVLQLGANQIGVALPLLAGSAGPYITEFTTGTGQPYILATQENAVPAVMMPATYTVAGAFPARVSYSPEELEMMTPEERSAYEVGLRRQSARVILERQPGQSEVGVPAEGEIPQAKAGEPAQPAPTAQVLLQGKPLAGKSDKEKGDSTQLLRIRPAKAVALRPEMDAQRVMEGERLAAEVNVGSAPVAGTGR